ncbi:uncharacterized protein LOC115919957 [Strongylocentrotus purpuratus]|uniref:C-type lectin domain-containing protein n=1 Tax=Strongylocentrotus purpuratus TaxID=7668 RepID=A0A7M7N3F3_STRPU|nr:uncharacterized protein LOC115919957 [Strongylocentrotus purpuratus]
MSSISSSSSIIGNDSGEMKTNEYDNVTAGNTDAFTIKRNDSTLYISCPDTTWDNAEDLCADREGRLIVPSSESLLETIVDSVSDACLEKHADGGEVELWLGCRLLKVDEENGKDLKLVDQWACRNDSSDDSGFSSMVTLYNWTANYKVSGISRDDKVCLQVKTKRGRHADDQNKYEFKREYCDNRKAKAVCILD